MKLPAVALDQVSQPDSPEQFGDYLLEALIGRGGMAEVFWATTQHGPLAGRPVALKRLLPGPSRDPVAADLFICEADITRYLDHPNIARVLDSGYVGERFFVVSELVDGVDLRWLLGAAKRAGLELPVQVAAYVALQLTRGLAYAHAARGPNGTPLEIVHCDLSPGNVLIGHDGEVKLTDFGVARTSFGTPIPDNVVVGKRRYVAPERLLPGTPQPQADLFSVGAILFEMLAGEPALDGKNTQVILENARRGRRRRLRRKDVPPQLARVVARCLSRHLEEPDGRVSSWLAQQLKLPVRYASADELAQSLSEAVPEASEAGPALAELLERLLEG